MDLMWDDVGVMRTGEGLQRGMARLKDVRAELLETGLADSETRYNMTWHDWLNLRSLVEMSQVIASAGMWRENSRGAHYREDFPDSGDLESSYFTVARFDENSELAISREPVDFSIIKPGETLLKDEPETLVGQSN